MSDIGLLRNLRIGMGIENGEERKRVLRAADDLERLCVFDLALALSELPPGTLWCVGNMEDGPFARIVWPQQNGGYSGGYREATAETVAAALRFAAASASGGKAEYGTCESCDPPHAVRITHEHAIAAAARQGGDVQQAPGAAPQSGHEVASPKPSQGAEQQQCRSGR